MGIRLYFLLNDLVLQLEPANMMHPLDADRFASLSADYIAQLGKEMFAEDAQAHRHNAERARRLAYLIQLKMPRVNAAQFMATGVGGVEQVEASFKSLNEMAMGMMYEQQMCGQLDAHKVDYEVWHRMAA
ncbi:hypothetical protein [Asticcacaulis sp. EMRT-3]|uniref:hypothetical protein n=1 Tax=Asticcacaulis sp. EMRT-3 TaxID=3040349 RepID=UPI0024AF3AB9|nr:hypothetical protein [Asticcacaulis sp. EMRT-3]MDI7775404.1 hypothetical protein [Asticcacaulis sp. EMRT-3]